ncbi:MAG: twin-arginine translocase TatA/TatE family subunit [Acidimicrobiia bacterium]
MLRNIGGPEILIILVVVLLLFGATRLPKLARSIGESAKELKAGLSGDDAEDGDDTTAGDTKAEASAETPGDDPPS